MPTEGLKMLWSDTGNYDVDYRKAVEWARGLLAKGNRDWVIFDTETTGLPQHNPELLQVGLLWPDGTPALDSLVKPDMWHLPEPVIPEEATAIHGITDAMVEDAPTLADLLPQMAEIMHGRTVVVYNAPFDFEVLLGCLYRRGHDWREPKRIGHATLTGASIERLSGWQRGWTHNHTEEQRKQNEAEKAFCAPLIAARDAAYDWLNKSEWQCAMLPYSAFVGDWHDYFGNYRWQRLPSGTHSALGDCQATLAVIQRMARQYVGTIDFAGLTATTLDGDTTEGNNAN